VYVSKKPQYAVQASLIPAKSMPIGNQHLEGFTHWDNVSVNQHHDFPSSLAFTFALQLAKQTKCLAV